MNTSRSEQVTAAALITLGGFQTALAVGAPWARAAYGGTRRGTLPRHLRTLSGAAALGYGTGAALVLRGSGSPRTRSRAFTILSAFLACSALVNSVSRAPLERALWMPVTAVAAISTWRSRTIRAAGRSRQ